MTIRNDAIDFVSGKIASQPDLSPLYDWLVVDGWQDLMRGGEDLLTEGQEFLVALTRDDLLLNEEQLRDNEHLPSKSRITDEMRVTFARGRVAELWDDDADLPSVHLYELETEDGRSAVVGCTVLVMGQGGPQPEWHGLFPTKGAFLAHLKKNGFLFLQEVEALEDEGLLKLWAGHS